MLLPPFALTTLPLLNAILNSLSAVLISSGYVAIRCRREPVHKACMLAACVTSALFLISYLTYHYHIGSKPFPGQGGIRLVYFTILLSHTLLAGGSLPPGVLTLLTASEGPRPAPRALARQTFQLWASVFLLLEAGLLMCSPTSPS